MTTTRRDFLKVTAVVGGGLTLGVSLPGAIIEAQAAGTLHTPNAWVHIADDNTITLISARSEMGQGVYTSMPMLIAEELSVDIRKVKVEIAPVGEVYTNTLLGGQLTGGSTSVREGWEKLRIAGAQVRTMLISAAAEKWQVSADKLHVSDGKVIGPGGRKATYGELADAASKLPVPKDVVLKDPKDFKIIGKATKRLDTPTKVNGKAVYGIDVKLPGMVYASLEQCPVIGGKVTSFDASKAKAMPGVIDVVQIRDGVAVVADSYWHAKKAREALTITWDEGPVAKIDNASMMEGIRNAKDAPTPIKKTGDADAAMKTAAKTMQAEYWSPLLAHATMEPQNFTADYKDGKCLVVGPAQFQQGTQGNVAAALGLKPEDVTVKTTFLGGGFGRRLEYDFAVQAAEISKAVGKPVKLLWSREDDTTHDFYRPMAFHRMAAGLDASGKPVALTFQLTSQSVTQRAFGLPKGTLDPFMAEASVVGYDIPNMTQELIEHDSGLRVGYWRSVSHALNAFANESFIDEMAAAAGKDPYQYRLALLDKQPRYANVLKTAATKAGWGKPLPAGRSRGIALMEGYDTYMAQVAEISVKDNEITVHKIWVVADLGQMVNPDTVQAQLESSIAFGLSSTLGAEITLDKGRVQQTNFHDYPVIRMSQMPRIDVTLVKSTEKPGGIGEPATALVGPVVANALFAATGKRVRKIPLSPDNIKSA
ncbi:aldehyde oxidase [Herbaspirillum sp. meg3]|uniref:xanthine dehydrogenase family protein molybdopterin-binding subunit n=1 Tax=Herbaspirillum sp. meg3 TaxID=2025949 RepID=UPI000B98A4A4|nr:xanthine dehydrogenase family protein molybdopterin-binding subunit [Herbaspirillum sp. meg3]ASU40765.1 aldehyde oxidase [Herbaspirillum sp. meg3]